MNFLKMMDFKREIGMMNIIKIIERIEKMIKKIKLLKNEIKLKLH